ncbi:MAG: N-acetylmuramoyl-L-alanine amidase [Clostridia bacterium]|nr:N-acetylmuramoyl-L-alanine amidase [Clostridia bacterium]
MTFYMSGSSQGQVLAECVITKVCEAVGKPLRSANPGDYFVIRESSAPAVIVECGFLSNSEDEKKLLTQEHRSTLAHGIADGITEYFSGLDTSS